MQAEFGGTLREWREKRRIRQLDRGLEAKVSARHISFLETGRSRPSRGMVIRLCEHLDVPFDERNRMLQAAGLAPAYTARERSAEEIAPVMAAVRWMLERHAPYPAFSVDRHWRLVELMAPAHALFAGVGMGPGEA